MSNRPTVKGNDILDAQKNGRFNFDFEIIHKNYYTKNIKDPK